MNKIIVFFKAHPIVKHVVYIILTTILLIIISIVCLESYTDHDSSLTVPDVRGLSVESAARLLDNTDLLYEVVDSVYTKDVPKGYIVEQDPMAGSVVKSGRKVYLVINSHTEHVISLPNVIDMSLRQTITVLETSGFQISAVTYKPSDYKDLVLGVYYKDQEVPAGTMMLEGSAVELYVGNGEGESDSITEAIDSLVYSEIIEGKEF